MRRCALSCAAPPVSWTSRPRTPASRRSPDARAAPPGSPTGSSGVSGTSLRSWPTTSSPPRSPGKRCHAWRSICSVLDDIDRRVLTSIIEKFDGGPVGLNTLSASISEDSDTIEDVYEPYLLQLGFLDRTNRGRVATRRAYQHLGIDFIPDPAQPSFFG